MAHVNPTHGQKTLVDWPQLDHNRHPPVSASQDQRTPTTLLVKFIKIKMNSNLSNMIITEKNIIYLQLLQRKDTDA